MKARLKLLLDNKIIDQDGYDIGLKIYQDLVEEGLEASRLEMLITHIARTVKKVNNGEKLQAIDDYVKDQIMQNENIVKASKLAVKIMNDYGFDFPDQEKDFLMLHLESILAEY
ncbi:PRD domain-containing protein [Peptoniphilaceae bacterium SGI.131]